MLPKTTALPPKVVFGISIKSYKEKSSTFSIWQYWVGTLYQKKSFFQKNNLSSITVECNVAKKVIKNIKKNLKSGIKYMPFWKQKNNNIQWNHNKWNIILCIYINAKSIIYTSILFKFFGQLKKIDFFFDCITLKILTIVWTYSKFNH